MTVAALLSTSLPRAAVAEDKADERAIVLSEGNVRLTAAESWIRTKPRNNIIDHEFAVPAEGDDELDGRITVMGAGGSVDANIARWIGQFDQPDGGSTKERAKIEKLEIAGQEVHLVDLVGIFKDQPRGPNGPTIQRENFRMLGAIIVTEKRGRYFVKLYGPRKTVAAHEEAFKKVIDSLKVESE